jgi:hypothetical protein
MKKHKRHDPMNICDQIRHKRDCGMVHCHIIPSASLSLAKLTRRCGLRFAPNIYREINKSKAVAIAIRILSRDLAYGGRLMSQTAAKGLIQQFLANFGDLRTQYYTNGYFDRETDCSWTPATAATFDTGILVISPATAGCLWVEDED